MPNAKTKNTSTPAENAAIAHRPEEMLECFLLFLVEESAAASIGDLALLLYATDFFLKMLSARLSMFVIVRIVN